jgi:hypothetical protein
MQIMPIEESVSEALAGYSLSILFEIEAELSDSRLAFAPFIISGSICAWAEALFGQNRYLSTCYLHSVSDGDYFTSVDCRIASRAYSLSVKALDSVKDSILLYRARDNPFIVFLDELHRLLYLTPQKERDLRIIEILKERTEDYMRNFTLEEVASASPPPPLSPELKDFLQRKSKP